MINLALVVPCYNEMEILRPYAGKADGYALSNLFLDEVSSCNFEQEVTIYPIFVNDGSSDESAEYLKKLSNADSRIHYINFSRNFGKEAALYAGLKKSLELTPRIDYVATMDVDLQDPPKLLPQMLDIVLSGEADTVATRRVTRKGEPKIRSFFARKFYKIINKISDTEIVDGSRDYRLMPRKMVEALVSMKEVNRFSKGLFSWVGFKTKWLEYENVQRVAGETKWSFWKLFKYSIDGIVSFSTVPLNFASFIGIATCFCAFVYLIFVIVKPEFPKNYT